MNSNSNSDESTKTKTLLLFDFDRTVIPTDTDQEVFEQLGLPEFNTLAAEKVRTENAQWTELMDSLLLRLQKEKGLTAEGVIEAMKRVGFDPTMHTLLRDLAAHPEVHMMILSDANDAYIRSVLDAQVPPLFGHFQDVITNRSYVDEDGLLRIAKRRVNTDTSFGKRHERCKWSCSHNLCKGEEVERIVYGIAPGSRAQPLEQDQLASMARTYARVIYIGDGHNDFCPSTRLHPSFGDLVFVRRGFSLEKRINKQVSEGSPGIVAKWEFWDSYEELAELFKREISGLGTHGTSGSGGRL